MIYGLSEQDIAVLKEIIGRVKGLQINTPSRPQQERMFTEGADHQAPEVYIAKIPAEGIDGLTDNAEPADDNPGRTNDCQFYRIVENLDGTPELREVGGMTRNVHNVGTGSVTGGYAPVLRTKGGRWVIASAGQDELYWCILMEAHPGQGQCFDLLVGTWCPSEHQFRFDCDAEEFETGIDFHYGVPYPEEPGARGWFKRMPSAWTTSGYIYVCVSLGCESPGACDAVGDDLPCLTLDGDPCEKGS